MKLSSFKDLLARNSHRSVKFVLPTGEAVAPEYHITEVGRVTKRFVDCGGTLRSSDTAQLQLWIGPDSAHRLTAGKVSRILEAARPLLPDEPIEVEVEHEQPVLSQYRIEHVDVEGATLEVRLAAKQADCLAKEQCGVAPDSATEPSCCGSTGCCQA